MVSCKIGRLFNYELKCQTVIACEFNSLESFIFTRRSIPLSKIVRQIIIASSLFYRATCTRYVRSSVLLYSENYEFGANQNFTKPNVGSVNFHLTELG